jgi:hypothetical protein
MARMVRIIRPAVMLFVFKKRCISRSSGFRFLVAKWVTNGKRAKRANRAKPACPKIRVAAMTAAPTNP